jgi:hypothetical protein
MEHEHRCQAAGIHANISGVCANWNQKQRLRNAALGQGEHVKYWEIIADRLHAEGWSYGIAEHFTKHGFLFCVDAHRDGKRFIVKADDLLTAFLSLERDAPVKCCFSGV